MPYCQTFTTPQQIHIAIWHLTETLDELMKLWGKEEYPQRFIEANAEKRRREILATALLMREYFGRDIALRHAPNGAPLIDEGNISISHTATHIAIALHPTCRVGIDIEKIGNRAERVVSRFMSANELAQLPQEDTSYTNGITDRALAIHMAWSVKEAVFKIHPTAIEFRRDIILSPMHTLPPGSVTAHLSDSDTPIEAHYTLYDGCSLAWTLQP